MAQARKATTSSSTPRRASQAQKRAQAQTVEATEQLADTSRQSAIASLDTLATFSEVSQQVTAELVNLSVSGMKEGLRLYTDTQSSILDALQATYTTRPANPGVFEGWQRLLEGAQDAMSRYVAEFQRAAEGGTERLQQAVNDLARQAKASGRRVAA